jgi:hypothetical protein
MPDDHNPKPFTDAQRELFEMVAKLNRAYPDDFAEADEWIDTEPLTAVEKMRQERERVRQEMHERRRRKDRSWLLSVPGQMAHDWRQWTPKDEHYRQEKARVLTGWRRDHARGIRCCFENLREQIREEAEHGPFRPYELIDFKARELSRANLDFDSMNPQRKARFARRVLRIVWILTDTADLAATKLKWLREWKWGEFESEFLVLPGDGPALPVPRLWSRTSILDRELDEWERLTRAAMRALEQVPTPRRATSELATRMQQLADDIGSRRSISQPLRQNAADLSADAGKLLKDIRKNRQPSIDDRRLMAHLQESLTALSDLRANRQVQVSCARLQDAAKGITTSTDQPMQRSVNGEHRGIVAPDPAAPPTVQSVKRPLSDLQSEVWKILESRTARYDRHGMPNDCLTGNQIADELAKAGIRNQDGKSIGDVIRAIRVKGWKIDNQQGQGYFIPKAPSESIRSEPELTRK